MRIIAGIAKGKKLLTPDNYDIRPTTDKVKEGLFSAIQFDLPGAKVLDLFSGSGQLGIEALSRGAEYCVFCDISPKSVKLTEENIKSSGFAGVSKVIRASYSAFLNGNTDKFDVIFIDPPYDSDFFEDAILLSEKHLNSDGMILCEHSSDMKLDDNFKNLTLRKEYKYGKTVVTLFKKA